MADAEKVALLKLELAAAEAEQRYDDLTPDRHETPAKKAKWRVVRDDLIAKRTAFREAAEAAGLRTPFGVVAEDEEG